jgi:hypothetical protein
LSGIAFVGLGLQSLRPQMLKVLLMQSAN